jgi:16S rRNA (cytosine967-C5)-methyltransferase
MSVSRARQIAFETLRRVASEGAYASDVLHAALDPQAKPALKTEDAGLATELVMGVLRWQRLLDFQIEKQMKRPVTQLDLPVLLALRLGLYQLRFLDKIPEHAAVHESVEMVKLAKKTSATGLVNAVLRRIAPTAKMPLEKALPANLPEAERLGILWSQPTWMIARWLARFGAEKTLALLATNNRAPRLSCGPRDPSERDAIRAELEQDGLQVAPGSFLKDAFAVSGGSPTNTPAFHAGKFSIQDEASQAIPLLLSVRAGERVLDLCAAPGGKTAALRRAAGDGGLIVAADVHLHRVFAMREQCERDSTGRIGLIALDATKPLPFSQPFKKILVDAPCSGTGTLARHPEIRWRLEPGQMAELHDLQTGILTQALAQLAPGGRLVYSTCSLDPEENEQVVDEALAKAADVQRVPASEAQAAIAPYLLPGTDASRFFDERGNFRTLPGDRPCDGFFAAILEKH